MVKDPKVHYLRRTLLAGLLILLPLFVTYVLVSFLFELFTGVGAPLVRALLQFSGIGNYPWISLLTPIVNLLLALAVIFLLGLIGTNILGRKVLAALEALLLRLPLVKTIYSSTKQLVSTLQGPGRSFQRVVLIEYPRKGLWMIGFVAAERRDTLRMISSEKVLAVFIPTTPNPTSGFMVMASPDQVIDLDFSVEEAFTFVFSSGIVGKDPLPARPQAT